MTKDPWNRDAAEIQADLIMDLLDDCYEWQPTLVKYIYEQGKLRDWWHWQTTAVMASDHGMFLQMCDMQTF